MDRDAGLPGAVVTEHQNLVPVEPRLEVTPATSGLDELGPDLLVCLEPVAVPESITRVPAGLHQVFPCDDAAGPLVHGRVAPLGVLFYLRWVSQDHGAPLLNQMGRAVIINPSYIIYAREGFFAYTH